MRKFHAGIGLCLIILLIFVLLNRLHWLGPLATPVHALLDTPVRWVSGGAQWVRTSVVFLGSIGTLGEENTRLRDDNVRLQAALAATESLQQENSSLREQLQFRAEHPYTSLEARVVSVDQSAVRRALTIDRGSADGIAVGQAVVAPNGALVGRITQTTTTSAQVLLITDGASKINATLSAQDVGGILKGNLGLSLVLDLIPQETTVTTGMTVITSGLGGEMPRGLLIGTVGDVHKSDQDLFQSAAVLSPVILRDLRLVFVLRP